DYFSSTALNAGIWGSNGYAMASGWAGATGQDPHSLYVHPRWANAAGQDFHPQSQQGRWKTSGWVTDPVTALTIDAADPTESFANEPSQNGGAANLGSYGNTSEASQS